MELRILFVLVDTLRSAALARGGKSINQSTFICTALNQAGVMALWAGRTPLVGGNPERHVLKCQRDGGGRPSSSFVYEAQHHPRNSMYAAMCGEKETMFSFFNISYIHHL